MKLEEFIDSCDRSYWYHLELKEKIYARANLALTVSMALTAALFFMSRYVFDLSKFEASKIAYILYLIFIALSSAMIISSIRFFYKVIVGNEYTYYDVKIRHRKFKDVVDIYKNNGSSEDEACALALRRLEMVFLDSVVEATDRNRDVNNSRTKNLLLSNRYLAIAALFELVVASLYLYTDSLGDVGSNVQKVEVVKGEIDTKIDPTTIKIETIEIGIPDYLRKYLDEKR